MELKPVELTAGAFADYGVILHEATGEPMADNDQITYWGKVAELRMSGRVSTGLLVNHRRPCVVAAMERHTKTPEILAALEGDSVLCVGRPSPGKGPVEGIRVFHVRAGDAIAMHAGTWHCVPFPVGCDHSRFLVVFASGTETDDLEMRDLAEPVTILGG